MWKFRYSTLCAVLLAALLHSETPAMSQEFPKKQPVKIVVASNAGGLTDSLARITAEFLQRRLGQAVVVENRTGAGSAIGADYAAKSKPDGYTIYLAGAELAVLPAVRSNLPYKIEEFTYLIQPFINRPLIMVGPQVQLSSLTELVAHMKANPGKFRYGSTGVGAINHIGTVLFEAAAGVQGKHVPYSGIAPVYTDLLAGNVDFTMGGSVPFPQGIKILGTVGSKRSPIYPDLPTLEEVGIKGATWDVWFGFVAPPNLPKALADRLTSDLGAVFKDPEAIAKYQSVAKVGPETDPLIGDDFKQKVLDDQKNWKAAADREKIVVQQ
jgi:tripartite-type tricarboxylate transporter receptor subunit TctC